MLRYKGLEGGRFLFDVDGVRVVVGVTTEEGTVRVASMTIAAPEVTSNVVRRIPFGPIKKKIIAELRRHPALIDEEAILAELVRGSGGTLTARLEEAERNAYRRVAALHRREGREYPEAFWREVALWYRRTLKQEPRSTVERMAEERGVPVPTVRTWIRRARQEGWLSEGRQGRAGADLGPRMIEYVNEEGDD